jgi:hypothetical protein
VIKNSEIETLIKKTETFRNDLIESFNQNALPNNAKSALIADTFEIVLEHSIAINLLISQTLITTALAVFRLQYDALVREVWLLYAASDLEIEKLSVPLSSESAQSINNWIPSTNEMLKQLELKAPAGLYRLLDEFKNYSSKALNSFVHTGIHAIARKKEGFYSGMVILVLKQSNNLVNMAALALSGQYGNEVLINYVLNLHKKHPDCFQTV